ncbi:MAG: hypothetical protein EOO50_06680 [Flavobacterium sp.]|uniref:hypothetical protein n=1 Tax=Flavobacterium sp. TaxID=239 RepID=UPI0011F6D588|nr:hypothetical protein [Flavobacterium sp.]RZJ67203.1 MAG: hypothetical protein EOO50_06680 [Flavobacterium sp.]
MARNKMEKEFGEKLNQREIQPSGAAWDRLDAMLTATEAQPKVVAIRRNYKWLYIAAGFLGFLFIGTLFFRQGTATAPDQNTTIATQTAEKPEVQAPAIVDSVTTVIPKAQIAASSGGIESKKPSVRKVKAITRSSQKQLIADNTIINQNEKQPERQPDAIINQKTQLNQAATGPNADELLAAAQAKREENKGSVKVNARSLLSQVDSQAEEKLTLRQKALRALNKNYQQVKVAVENRNLDENH